MSLLYSKPAGLRRLDIKVATGPLLVEVGTGDQWNRRKHEEYRCQRAKQLTTR